MIDMINMIGICFSKCVSLLQFHEITSHENKIEIVIFAIDL